MVACSPWRESLIVKETFILFFLIDGSWSYCAKNVKHRAALAKIVVFYKGSAHWFDKLVLNGK